MTVVPQDEHSKGIQEGKIDQLKKTVIDVLSESNRAESAEAVLDQMTIEQWESFWSKVRKADKSDDWAEVDEILSTHHAHKP